MVSLKSEEIVKWKGLNLQEYPVAFHFVCSPRMTINGDLHVGAVTMTPNMMIQGNSLYLGGVPASVPLPVTDVPVTNSFSLNGGLRNLRINSV